MGDPFSPACEIWHLTQTPTIPKDGPRLNNEDLRKHALLFTPVNPFVMPGAGHIAAGGLHRRTHLEFLQFQQD